MTIQEYDAQAKGETVREYDPVKPGKVVINQSGPVDTAKIVKVIREAISFPIPGPFPRPVADGEVFTRAELIQQGLDVVYKHNRAVIQLRK